MVTNIYNSELEGLLAEADLLIKENNIANALNLLERILKIDSSFGKAHNHLAFIYEHKLALLDKAEEHYKKAIELSPNYLYTYYNYSYLLSTLKKFDELKQLLAKANQITGINKATICNEYAIMYELLGDYDEAINYYREYIKQIFDIAIIEKANESIIRCKRKKEILNS